MTKETLKRYAVSSGVTFLTGFLPVLYGGIDELTLESIKNGTFIAVLVGLCFVGFRGGIKLVIEMMINRLNK